MNQTVNLSTNKEKEAQYITSMNCKCASLCWNKIFTTSLNTDDIRKYKVDNEDYMSILGLSMFHNFHIKFLTFNFNYRIIWITAQMLQQSIIKSNITKPH